MPHMNNLNFLEYMFDLYIVHTIEGNCGEQTQHKM